MPSVWGRNARYPKGSVLFPQQIYLPFEVHVQQNCIMIFLTPDD